MEDRTKILEKEMEDNKQNVIEIKRNFLNKPNNEATIVDWIEKYLEGRFIAVKGVNVNGDRHDMYYRIVCDKNNEIPINDIFEQVNDDFILQLLSEMITDLIELFSKVNYDEPKKDDSLEEDYEYLVKDYKRSMANKKAKLKFLVSCGNHSRLMSILKLLKTRRSINRTPRDIIVPANLLPLNNGIFDLDTKTFRMFRYEDTITQKVSLNYNKEMFNRPRHQKLLDDWTNGDKEYQEYLQEFVGFLLSGKISERHFWFVYGPPGTGKSTFLEIIKRLLGPFYKLAPPNFMLKSLNKDDDRKVLPSLSGKRMIRVDEVSSDVAWNAEAIKAWSGDVEMGERLLYTNGSLDVVTSGKLVFVGNTKPDAESFNQALFERLVVLPFTNYIPIEQRLSEKSTNMVEFVDKLIAEEGEAILNWAIEGYEKFKTNKLLKVPKVILDAKSEYQTESNAILEWANNNTKPGFSSFKQLYNDYCQWCKQNNRRFLASKKTKEYFVSRWGKPERIWLDGKLSSAEMYKIGLRTANVNESFGKFTDID